ncbi:hypothetical protein BDQ12DRAFT_694031 [Crucibulum laeve]|uniref:Uncharacterized protein n=1 Tax=Crucibulum laeve TaxID=68775 RepID=A0A5C3LFM8_9AGAR|nr:hypothetical protein BDQ12DRAFT_694031 [Crucibulum laeve]
MSTTEVPARNEWPFITAQSTGTACEGLLTALLAADSFDEVSNAEDFSAVNRFLRNRKHASHEGVLTSGIIFWVYPTGLNGPYHKNDEGLIEKHGLLVTVERDVLAQDALEKIKTAFVTSGLAHLHIAAGST